MTSGKNKLTYSLFAFYLFAFIFTGCVSEDRDRDIRGQEGEEKEITFSLKVPGAGSPTSYSLSETDENKVEKVVVLLFNAGKLEYNPRSANVTNDIFTVKVPEGTYDMVVIANANNEVTGLQVGDTKETTLGKIQVSNTGKWETNTSLSGYRNIPMWGELQGFVANSSTAGTNISLTRMLARIDVNVMDNAQSKFTLGSVRLYNYYDKGRVAPIDANISNNIATAPSIPAGAAKPAQPVNSPLVYDGSAIAGNKCEKEIYTFEAEKSSDAAYLNGTCLVVGGIYQGETHYYRVDFVNNNIYLNLLRNHHYKVAIMDVSGPGFPSPEEAFKSIPVNINVNVLPWNNGGMSEFEFDGQYLLSISKGYWKFDENESLTGNLLKIYTDYPGGWTLINKEDASGGSSSWFDIDKTSGNENVTTDCYLSVSENKTSNTRIGYLYIKAGRMVYKITIVQNPTTNISVTSITVVPAEKTIYKGSSLKLIATVEPENATNKIVTWKTSNSSIADVDANGLVTAIKVGTAVTITATADGKSASSIITVIDGPYIPSPHKGWAGSNIYYDGAKGHLTFDDVGVTTNETVYGVFFKWGSLYGAAHLGTDFTNFTTASTHYPPAGGSATGKSWSGLPHVSESLGANANRAYLYEITNENTGIGDICKHLTEMGYTPGYAEGKRWRMPIGNEFGKKADYVRVDNTGFRNTVSGKGNPFFPLPGDIYLDPYQQNTGLVGHYWSSSPAGYYYGNQAYSLYLDRRQDNGGTPQSQFPNQLNRLYGASVRCVVE